jgi:hypothetical protein
MPTPDIEKLAAILNEQAVRIKKLEAHASALHVVAGLLADRYLEPKSPEALEAHLDSALLYAKWDDEQVELTKQYLRALLKRPS